MCTRSGSLDPSIVLYLIKDGMTPDQVEQLLNKESGLKGLSGVSGDTRVLFPAIAHCNSRAKIAIDVFLHRLRSAIGQMLASIAHLPDAIVFTDAIAESEPAIRSGACEVLHFLGVEIDQKQNVAGKLDSDLATDSSPVRVLLIESREAWQIAKEALELAGLLKLR
jgi:acetate kinase